jgi:hypothetical protein
MGMDLTRYLNTLIVAGVVPVSIIANVMWVSGSPLITLGTG